MIDSFDFGRVCVVGDVLLDRYIIGLVKRISPEAPVPVLHHSHLKMVPGGAANVAANAAALGCQVDLIGVVGVDQSADDLRALLSKSSGINFSNLVAVPTWPTITKTRIVSGHQQIVRVDEESIVDFADDVQKQVIAKAAESLKQCDVLVVSDYAKGVLSQQVLRAIIDIAVEHGVYVIVDPKKDDLSLYAGASLITPNKAELTRATGIALTDEDAITRASSLASSAFGGGVLLTRSEEGMSFWHPQKEPKHFSVRPMEVSDVSGAGDTVVATVAAVLSAKQSIEVAITIATTAAAISVSKLGTATVSREELSELLKANVGDSAVVLDLSDAIDRVSQWRRYGASIVFTNGCFDLIHPGHISLIRAAAAEGDKLVVGINSDASVKRLKGETRPVQDQYARAEVMSALAGVDLVIIFDEDTPLEVVTALVPDVLVKGADYSEDQVVGSDVVKSHGGRVVLANLIAGQSTSALIGRSKQ